MRITVVTITNRKRWALLRRTLKAAFIEGVTDAVVVDNEAEENIAQKVAAEFDGRCKVIRLVPNAGSAGAYHAGLKTAVESGAEFLLLLDDDNVLRPGSLQSLQSTYDALLDRFPPDNLCVSGYRAAQEALRGKIPEPHYPFYYKFLGFHFADIPAGILRRFLTLGKPVVTYGPQAPSAPVQREIAPWGGLYFHRRLLENLGYPDPAFVLYGDDIDFTYRISSKANSLWLDPHALIDDIDVGWLSERGRTIYFVAWIVRGSDEQVYYHLRNMAYLETKGRRISITRSVNRMLLLAILWLIALRRGRLQRFRLILAAVRDGECRVLRNSLQSRRAIMPAD